MPVRRGGIEERQGAGAEGGEQGGELAAEAAQEEREQDRLRQVEEATQATAAQRRQHHGDDAVEGFAQVLVAGFVHGRMLG